MSVKALGNHLIFCQVYIKAIGTVEKSANPVPFFRFTIMGIYAILMKVKKPFSPYGRR